MRLTVCPPCLTPHAQPFSLQMFLVKLPRCRFVVELNFLSAYSTDIWPTCFATPARPPRLADSLRHAAPLRPIEHFWPCKGRSHHQRGNVALALCRADIPRKCRPTAAVCRPSSPRLAPCTSRRLDSRRRGEQVGVVFSLIETHW